MLPVKDLATTCKSGIPEVVAADADAKIVPNVSIRMIAAESYHGQKADSPARVLSPDPASDEDLDFGFA